MSIRATLSARPLGRQCSRCLRESPVGPDVVASLCWACTAGYSDKLGKLDTHLDEKARKRHSKAL